MASPDSVEPVKRFVAILWSDPLQRDTAIQALVDAWGKADCIGRDIPFDVTDYYASEMGTNLFRRLIGFEGLTAPESMVAAKIFCNDLEHQLAVRDQRTVNLDVGYLDHHKIVLASMKYAGQKIHLAEGVYADLIARFQQGRYHRMDWTFPDFRDGRYDVELGQMRARYLEQLRDLRRRASSGEMS